MAQEVQEAQEKQQEQEERKIPQHLQLPLLNGKPHTNPYSKDFDMNAYITELQQLDLNELRKVLKEVYTRAYPHTDSLLYPAPQLLKELHNVVLTELLYKFDPNIAIRTDFKQKNPITADSLAPFLEGEVAALRSTPGYENVTIDTLIPYIQETGIVIQIDDKAVDPKYVQAIEKAIEKYRAAAVIEEITQELPRLQAAGTKHHTSPNNKLANVMTRKDFFDENGKFIGEIEVANIGKKNVITTVTNVTFENTESLSFIGKAYTEFDRDIQEGICSFYLEEKKAGRETVYFTPGIVYRAMNGKSGSETPSQQAIGAITKSIEKQWHNIYVSVDATKEVNEYRRKRGLPVKEKDKFIFGEHLLNLKKIEMTTGGKTVTAYQILSEPILLNYSKMTGQLLTAPSYLLDIKETRTDGTATTTSLPNTDGRTAIKNYLFRQVQVIKRSAQDAKWAQAKEVAKAAKEGREPEKITPKRKPVILFETIFEETGQTAQNRVTMRRNRDYAFQVLDYWKAEHFITDYKRKTKGKIIEGIIIDP